MRARAMGYAFVGFGAATLAPGGLKEKGVAGFLTDPAGVTLGALVLVMLGLSVEEMGTMPRIRAGLAIRLAGAAVAAAAVVWIVARGTPQGVPSGLGWTLIAV